MCDAGLGYEEVSGSGEGEGEGESACSEQGNVGGKVEMRND